MRIVVAGSLLAALVLAGGAMMPMALAAQAAAESVAWTEDAAAAMAAAAKEKKDLLIDFTGSDWCGWCTRLDDEVFSKKPFTAEAPKHFVFLKLDFPRKRELSEALKKQNAEWRDKYGISGFPTIVLADATGKPYAQTGYQPGGPEKYLEHLAELRQVHVKVAEAMAKAAAAQGVEKAKLLDAALSALDPSLVMPSYSDVVDEILKLDPDNKAGLKTKYEAIALLNKVQAALRGGNSDEALKLADAGLKTVGATGQPAQDLLYVKSLVLYRKQDKAGAKAALEAALKAAPEGAKAEHIQSVLDRVFKDAK